MKIKTPLVIDLSHWEKVPDFSKIDPQPIVVIMKATEGNTIVDGSFADFWGRTSGKYCRMAYHFFRKDKPVAEQAELFVKTVTNSGLHAKDVLILDIEEEKTPASKIVEWLSYVDAKVSNEILIYSRKNILEPIVRTPEQVEFLKKYKIWTAGYPFTPDNFSSVPTAYVPNPDQWGKTVLWQYSESAKLPGIEGAVDVNWIDPEYAEDLLGTAVPDFEGAVIQKLDNILSIVNYIQDKMDDSPDPEPEPEPNPPAEDGYTGMYLGKYTVDLKGKGSILLLDSYGNQETIVMDKMVDWLKTNCPGWSDFIKNKFVTYDGKYWRITGKVVNGQTIAVAEIAKGRARIIGFDSEGDSWRGAKNLDVLSPTKTPWYFHKIANVARYYPIIQPRQAGKKALQAWWIPVEYIIKKEG